MPQSSTRSRYDVVRQILLDEDVRIASAFFAGVVAVHYDLEVMAMDGEALIAEIESNLNHTLPDFNRAKVLLGQGVYFTDLFENDLPSFIDLANATTAPDGLVPGVFNPANVFECSAAVIEMGFINLGEDDDKKTLQFSEEIRQYWGAVLASEGYGWQLPPLTAAIMPGEAIDRNIPEFEAMATMTGEAEKALSTAMWSYGKDIFDQVKKLPTQDGQPAISASQAKAFLASLIGEQPTAG